MTGRSLQALLLIVVAAILSFALPAQEVSQHAELAIADLLVERLGIPEKRADWHGITTLDYRLRDGRTLTIAIRDSDIEWTGFKTDFQANVNKQVELHGHYWGPGKEANFIHTVDGQTAYMDVGVTRDGTYPKGLMVGDAIVAHGLLRFRPGGKARKRGYAGSPDLYFLEKPIVRLAAPTVEKPEQSVAPERR